MTTTYRIILFLAGIAAILASPCPSGWFYSVKFGFCYIVPQKNGSPVMRNWNASDAYCQTIGAQLAPISSTFEYDDIVSITNASIYSTWFGQYRKADNASVWFNSDGSFGYLSTKWLPGEPAPEGNCASLRSITQTGYRAQHCGYQQPFVCRQKAALCANRNISGNKGEISSPNYPNYYDNNLDCLYTITAPVGTYVTLIFDYCMLEDGPDYVNIYDGTAIDAKRKLGSVDSYNWKYDKDTFESTSNQISIYFHTDYMITYKGWHATWAVKAKSTPITVSGVNGTLESPNYPSNYPPFSEQYYYINSVTGTQIQATFDDFYTENNYDILQIYDSPAITPSKLIANFTGSKSTPFSINSTSNHLSMRFISDAIVNYRGFHLSWSIF